MSSAGFGGVLGLPGWDKSCMEEAVAGDCGQWSVEGVRGGCWLESASCVLAGGVAGAVHLGGWP
eukprot:14185289-Alexandrium_andersonii.AAC.1